MIINKASELMTRDVVGPGEVLLHGTHKPLPEKLKTGLRMAMILLLDFFKAVEVLSVILGNPGTPRNLGPGLDGNSDSWILVHGYGNLWEKDSLPLRTVPLVLKVLVVVVERLLHNDDLVKPEDRKKAAEKGQHHQRDDTSIHDSIAQWDELSQEVEVLALGNICAQLRC
eukprot:3366495-Rhodomonas_salina.1